MSLEDNKAISRRFIEELWNERQLNVADEVVAADGRIVEDWVLVDFLGVFQQLGIVRPTAELLAKADHETAEAGQ